ncbi:MAG: TIGR04211 family SH3 domain-containing protein [Proteobacteria bacterium]|nr:TIGR04211 family SH3 domain-containing protein [Desulfobacula sp.]MBU3952782.1 TIGR04211 family SH3 domain-containing protein [Pseudomonadota bacterium]MBU4132206.1 TIGR04211 family SH3 domain-containing protein [Pseudomonadota bacterium]
MRQFLTGLWILALLILSVPGYSQARTGYVSDMLILTFREGPGTSYSILQTLKSNTALTIQEEDNGYYKVMLDSGETGWVDKQFVVFETPKAMIIQALEKEKKALESQLETLAQDHELLKSQMTDKTSRQTEEAITMENHLKEALEKNRALAAQLKESQSQYSDLQAQSQNVLEIVEKNKELAETNKHLSDTLAQLENQTSHLFRTGMIKWFLAGVGVLLLGWIIGQSVSSKKRRSGSLLG